MNADTQVQAQVDGWTGQDTTEALGGMGSKVRGCEAANMDTYSRWSALLHPYLLVHQELTRGETHRGQSEKARPHGTGRIKIDASVPSTPKPRDGEVL